VQLSHLVDAKMGGVQGVIAEQFKSIEKRLGERDIKFDLVSKDQKDAIATALTAVTEAGKQHDIKFDVLERRVSALELAIAAAGSKASGVSAFATTVTTAMGTGIALLMAFFAYWTMTHK
jgi:uncharacterized ferredoxin-like protein